MVGLRRAAILIAVTLCAGQAALAQSDDALMRARTHFEAGRALYLLGNYTEAVREFAAGYQLVPRPQFLLNLGQCYKKLNQLDKTRDMYERFLRDVAPNDPERGPAQQELRDIERQIAEQPPSPTPPSGPDATHPSEPPPQLVAPAAATTVTASAPPRKSWIKRNWWIIPVGVVVVGAAVGVGVYFGTRTPSACQPSDIACYDFSMVKP